MSHIERWLPDAAPLARWVIVLAGLLVLAGGGSAADPGSPRLVVALYANESDGAPGVIAANRALRAVFDSRSPVRVDVRNEYVDTSRLGDPEFKQAQVEFLRRKYAGRKVDLVMAGLSSALDFALEHRDRVFPGVPVVYLAVDRREVDARRLPPDVTGVPIQMDLTGTLDLALRLHPDTRRVYVVAGAAPFDTRWEGEARRLFAAREPAVEFVYLSGLPMDVLLRQVAELPPQSLVYYLHMFQDGGGHTLVPAEALERLAERCNAPIYGHVDTYVGRGLVGGRVFTFESVGTDAARLGLRILAGEAPSAIALPAVTDSSPLFDGRQLRRWGIPDHALPPGAVVRFREPSVWESYGWQIAAAAAFCWVQTWLIAGLLAHRWKWRRAVAALLESEARFRRMADAAPVFIWEAGPDRGCTYLNRPWVEFTGRDQEQDLGDRWADAIHSDDRQRCLNVYAAGFDAREPFEMEFRLRRRDGEYRWMLSRGVPRYAVGGRFAGFVGACSDITDRRRAEEEQRLLTGRLIEAQEGERRRIARELHDDLNQGLALLSLELDLLGHVSPASAVDLADRLRELSTRVKELSSVVHDLSHQLHPSKLEQLGLVAAVRGLCQELSLHHGLNVAFTLRPDRDDSPTAIDRLSPDTSLCLYRIVQEALHNVAKHSGSRRATVLLSGAAGTVRLRVTDVGVGFDPDTTGGLGLVSMRERLHLVGGRMVIHSTPGHGTRIVVRVPAERPTRQAVDEADLRPAGRDGGLALEAP